MQAGSSAAAAAAAGSSILQTSSSLEGGCKLSVLQHRNAHSSGDDANDSTTPLSTASGGSTPGRLKRAFLAAVRGEQSAAVTSMDAWDQIVKRSRQQHKRICYGLLVTIVILAAVGAGGIAAGAKAKAAHQRSVDAAAAEREAWRNAPADEIEDEGTSGVVDALRLGFGVTLSVMTSEPQQQACLNWFRSEERTLQYEQLFTAAYSAALGVPQSDMTVDNVMCGASPITTSSNGSNRALKQAGTAIEVLTIFSTPQQPDTNSTNITTTIMTKSGSILRNTLSEFFTARVIVTQAGPTSSNDSSVLPSTADIAVKGFTAAKPQPPAATPAEQAVKSGAAAADIIKAGGIAAQAVGAAPVSPSQAAAAAAHRNDGSPGSIPLVVVDHDGTVIINAPDEVLMQESAALNATQTKEFQDAWKAGRAKQGGQGSSIEVQLPPGLAVQDLSQMPDNLIPVTNASFVASEPPSTASAVETGVAAEVHSTGNSSSSSSNTSSSSSSNGTIPGAAAVESPGAPAAAVTPGAANATTSEATATAPPTPAPSAASPVVSQNTNTNSTAVTETSAKLAPEGAAEPRPNPSTPAAETAILAAIPEDPTSHPATTTFFPEVHEFTLPESAPPTPGAAISHSPSGPPTESELAAYNWDSVLLDSYEITPMCPFTPARGNFMSDALGRLWSLANGHACTFKAPNPITLAADPSGTKGSPLITWETAADCGEAPNASNSVKEASGHTWGWTDGVSCAFKAPAAADQANNSSSSSGVSPIPRMDTVWEVAPVCSDAPMKFTAVPDVFGRLWGIESDGRSCAYKYTGV